MVATRIEIASATGVAVGSWMQEGIWRGSDVGRDSWETLEDLFQSLRPGDEIHIVCRDEA